MIDKDILEYKKKLDQILEEGKYLLHNYKRVGFENERIYRKIESLDELITYVNDDIERLLKPTCEGELGLLNDGRYGIVGTPYYFCCGTYIEIYNPIGENEFDKWLPGNVEGRFKFNNNGEYVNYYYFNSADDEELNFDLYEGLKVRVRI